MENMKKILLLLIIFGVAAASSCDKNGYKNNGLCDEELYEIVEEEGIVHIHIDLKMEDYTSEHNLTESEIEEQRRKISNLQEEFIKSLEGTSYTLTRKGTILPWLSMFVEKEALSVICKSTMVKDVQKVVLEETHSK